MFQLVLFITSLDFSLGDHDSVYNLASSTDDISTKRKAADISENDTHTGTSSGSTTVRTSGTKRQRQLTGPTNIQTQYFPPQLVLYSFPSYDKSDSAIYFPSTFTRLFNGGDFEQLYKLFSSHMDMNCDMNVTYMNAKPNTQNLTEFYSFFIDMFPDMVMCVDSISVVENQIRAVIYRKYTDVKAIKDGLIRATKTPIQNAMLQTFLQRERFLSYGLTKKEKKELKAILKQETDLEVFLRMQMILRLDHNGKFVNLMIITGLETVNPVQYNTSSASSIPV